MDSNACGAQCRNMRKPVTLNLLIESATAFNASGRANPFLQDNPICLAGKSKVISPAAQNGLVLFREKARCTKCHSGFNFTDEKFHNLGIGWDDNRVDLGRYMVTGNAEEIGAFKTPTLRGISRSAPYMHDGRFKTLEEVVNFYNKGGIKNPHQDNLIIPLELTDQEKHDLVEFLRTLKGEGWQQVKAPTSFPK